ncbi:MAG: DNA polymerase III subunit alpha [Chlorobi bacterium]|nr:DNA polymerase III subunit alpha [Chlorobiota bacterium]
MSFVHLHLHSQYSLLDGAVKLKDLMRTVKEHGSPAVALTDHGNMYGTFQFVRLANESGIKPIVGCEVYLVNNMHEKSAKEKRLHQLLLAMDEEGFRNLSRIVSLGFLEGYYSKPRVDKELIKKYSKGLIATSSCLQGEIPQAILKGDIEKAERLLRWWLDVFGENYYIELQRHGIPEQDKLNMVLLQLADKYSVPVVATNDVHYLDEEDYEAHDVLLCIQTGKKKDDPKRLRFDVNEFYLKSPEEMKNLFADIPQAIENTLAIADKVKPISLTSDVLLPKFPIPPEFESADEYLRHLAIEGAKREFGDPIPDSVLQRLEYELGVIKRMGFSSYFLIVRDIIAGAKDIGVRVGPGRGSAAGSLVAYTIGITQIDPLKYNLLFERFLNPDRISMPDIDIDFDDRNREKVINYIVNKYGKEYVAHIITFGTMAARSSIRDVGRVLGFKQSEIEELAKLIPDAGQGRTLSVAQALQTVTKLKQLYESNEKIREWISIAIKLEGSIRQTGVHAAGIIISPSPLLDTIPIASHKDMELPITQWEYADAEAAGLLKMDILGLANLTIISDTLEFIKNRHGESAVPDIDNVPLDDPQTYKLYQEGRTIGTFQFESEGMRKYLKQLKPTVFEDLIAMNALYRPGPMEYIPSYIRRKHGQEKITYKHPDMEPILKDTYGIMVYQEQLMMVAQKLAGFTPGEADTLRKAVGKKKADLIAKLKEKFIEGCVKNNIPKKLAEEIFADIEKFGQYGFNKSHAAAYSFLAFQTAYLKAHYPAEYMAALLSNAIKKPDSMLLYLNEARSMGIKILPPDINQSEVGFTVTKEGHIRFGLGAIKNVGSEIVSKIIQERAKNGEFKSIFDLGRRVPGLNKKVLESLVWSGAFDSFGNPREAYAMQLVRKPETAIEYAAKLASKKKTVPAGPTLFSLDQLASTDNDPELPKLKSTNKRERLIKEHEMLGFFISGHPLDEFKYLYNMLPITTIADAQKKEGVATFLVVPVKIDKKVSKNGNIFYIVVVEDFTGIQELRVFERDYDLWNHLLQVGEPIIIMADVSKNVVDDRVQWKIIKISTLEEFISQNVNGVHIKLPAEKATKELAENIKALLTKPSEGKKLFFELSINGLNTSAYFSSEYAISPQPEKLSSLYKLLKSSGGTITCFIQNMNNNGKKNGKTTYNGKKIA